MKTHSQIKGRPFVWPTIALLLTCAVACTTTPSPERIKQQAEAKARQETAMRMWKERCATKAGVKIHRTVDNVDGIFLMKIRPDGIMNYGDQFKMDDPYGSDSTGDRYILNFLKGFYHQQSDKPIAVGSPPREGYRYVEAVDPEDGQRYRYTAGMKVVGQKDISAPAVMSELARNPSYDINIRAFMLDKVPANGPHPRYGVTYEDISTHEEREYWIAGSSLRVVDLQTNAVIAERIGYMVDWAQGSTVGFRSPWLFAADNACPDFNSDNVRRVPGPGSSAQASQTIVFVEKVLKPSK